jgi:hypothetical protein
MAMLDDLIAEEQVGQFPEQSLLGAIERQKRPADPLRWLRDKIPQNTDGGLSMLNMIREALGTSANWLDGTPEIGPDTLAPLGLAGFGMLAPKAAASSRAMADNARSSAPGTVVNSLSDPEIIAHLEKRQRQSQYADTKLQRAEEKKAAWHARRGTSPAPAKPTEPDSIAGHLMVVPRGIAVNDGTAGLRATDALSAELAKDGIRPATHLGVKFPGAGRPTNDLFADNARSSAPGTVVNSLGEVAQIPERAAVMIDGKVYTGANHSLALDKAATRLGVSDDDFMKLLDRADDGFLINGRYLTRAEAAKASGSRDGYIGSEHVWDLDEIASAKRGWFERSPGKKVRSGDIFADPIASAPGLAANSTQISEPMLMELIRRMNEGET